MIFSFNLIDEPWIPCIRSDNSFTEVSLRDLLLDAHNLRVIACETPLINAAIMPIALTLLYRAFGPLDRLAWNMLWKAGAFSPVALNDYFSTWYERFDLFHPERPFYQAQDDRVKPKSVIHLVHSIGNTGTLFTHATDEARIAFSPGEAARNLVTAQAFRTSGLSGIKEKFTDSPMARGVLFWAYGENLFETLMLNLFPYPDSLIPITPTGTDVPSWEQENPFEKRRLPKGYLDYLTWPGKRIQLFPVERSGQVVVEMMTIAPGLTLSGEVISPQKCYIQKSEDEDWRFLYFNTDKSLWRDYHSLFTLHDEKIRPPTIIQWLDQLAVNRMIDEHYRFRLVATGMLADKSKPIFYRQEYMPLPLVLLDNRSAAYQVSQAILIAEYVSQALYSALNILAESVLMRGGEQPPDARNRRGLIAQWGIMSLYWERLEPLFWKFLLLLQDGQADTLDYWRAALKQHAIDTFSEVGRFSGKGVYALQGQVMAERRLSYRLNDLPGEQE